MSQSVAQADLIENDFTLQLGVPPLPAVPLDIWDRLGKARHLQGLFESSASTGHPAFDDFPLEAEALAPFGLAERFAIDGDKRIGPCVASLLMARGPPAVLRR